MAEAWGAWQCQYNYKDWRGGVNAWVVSETATTATIRVEARYNSPFARQVNTTYAYTNCDGNNSGWVGTGGLNQPSNVDTTYVRRTQDYVIAKGSSGRNVWCAAGVQIGGSYSPGTSEAGVNVWINAISYKQPHPPKNQAVTKNSDWQATVTWTGDYTDMNGLYPWDSVYIDRKVDGGAWTLQFATVSWDKTSYVDKSITTGHTYQYGLRSHGPGGTSDRVQTGTITTSYTPNAPTSCSASRVSDSQAKVTWKNNPATNRPYTAVYIERQTDSGSWTQIASLGSSTANYTDNGISSNHRYAYRVRAHNNAGNSGYATSGYIYTTPKAPSSVTVTKVSYTQVSVNITGAAPYATSYNVQYQLNGGPWTSAGSTSSWPFKHTPGGGTVKYRVQAVRSSLSSGWVESGTIQTVMPPNAPTVSLSPSASVVPVGTALSVSWKPNHPDGSAQSSAQVEVTVGSAAAVVRDVSGSTRTYAIGSQSSATTVKVRVRTKGLDPDWGAWSGYAAVSVAVVPTGYFTYPAIDGAAIGGIPVDLEWSVTDPAGVASQTLSILGSDGTDLYSVQLGGSVRELSIGPDRYSFANLTTYRIRLTVLSGSGLSTVITRSFQTSWAGPADPYPLVTYGDGLSASVTVGDSESFPGDVIEIDRPAGSLLPGLTVYGATRQNLWVNPSEGPTLGCTATPNSDGSVTISGTNTSSENNAFLDYANSVYTIRPNTTYTLSVYPAPVTGLGFTFRENDSSDESLRIAHKVTSSATAITFKTSSRLGSARFYAEVKPGATVSGTYRVMLNEGSEPEPWCPPGLNSVESLEIVTAGKNLWASKAFTDGGITAVVNDDGSVTLDGTSTSSEFNGKVTVTGFLPPGEYTLSVDRTADENASFFVRAVVHGAAMTLASVRALSKTFTIPVGTSSVICGVQVVQGNEVHGTFRVQLERGATATDWVSPVAVTSTPIDLDGNQLCSLPDGTRDELTINEAGKLTLTQRVGVATAPTAAGSWSFDSIGERATFSLPSAGPASKPDETEWLLCDKLPVRDGTSLGEASYAIVNASTAYAKNPAITSTATAATIAGGMTILYPLATPQEIDLGSIAMPELPSDRSQVFAATPVPTEVMAVYPETESFSVTRVSPDGSQWLVAEGLTQSQQALDPLPPLNTDYFYIVTSYSETGTATTREVPARVDSDLVALNYGTAAATFIGIPYNVEWSRDYASDWQGFHFADGGSSGGLPTLYSTGSVDVTGQLTGVILDIEDARRLDECSRLHPIGWVRDPNGYRALCAIDASISEGYPRGKYDASLKLTEGVFQEAW